jgi:hypothetical protein
MSSNSYLMTVRNVMTALNGGLNCIKLLRIDLVRRIRDKNLLRFFLFCFQRFKTKELLNKVGVLRNLGLVLKCCF